MFYTKPKVTKASIATFSMLFSIAAILMISAPSHSKGAVLDEPNTDIQVVENVPSSYDMTHFNVPDNKVIPTKASVVPNVKPVEESVDTPVESPVVSEPTPVTNDNTELSSNVAEQVVTTEPAAGPEAAPEPAMTPEPIQNSQPAMTMIINGVTIPYINGGIGGGQSAIDSNPNGIASTYFGAPFNGNDGLNTHIIGHSPGIFSVVFSLSVGNQISITDGAGNVFVYTVIDVFDSDDYGINTVTGADQFDYVTNANSGEHISLQTCINDDINRIVIASK